MSNRLYWSGSEVLVRAESQSPETFILDAPTLALKQVDVGGVISDPEKVQAIVKGFTPLRNKAIWDDANFKVVGNSIVFDDVDLSGFIPPLNSTLLVSYPTATDDGDVVKENPEIKVSISYDSVTKVLKLASWVHEKGQIVAATSCDFEIFNSGVSAFEALGVLPDAENIFYTAGSNLTLPDDGLYLAKVKITTPTTVYTQAVPLSILAANSSSGDIGQIDTKIDLLTITNDKIYNNQIANEFVTPQGVMQWLDSDNNVLETFDLEEGQLFTFEQAVVKKTRRS